MPELPEVTTTVEGIRETSLQQNIVALWSDWPRLFPNSSLASVRKKVVGKKITLVERCGKQILFHIGDDVTLVAHMKMTGHFMYGAYIQKGKHWVAEEAGPLRDDPYNKYIHFAMLFENGKSLVLSDARKFAKIRYYRRSKIARCEDITEIGPDALRISLLDFTQRLHLRPKGKIKQVLLNQEIIAGVGNIYSDESLWRAGILPTRSVQSLSKKELAKLRAALREVLSRGIHFKGDSDSDYRNVHGERGNFQNHHRVYRKTGRSCAKRDGGIIQRILVGGRSTHFCPIHQT